MENDPEKNYFTFHIHNNNNITDIPKETGLWRIIDDDLIQSKTHHYEKNSDENFNHAISLVKKLNGFLRFKSSNPKLFELKDIGVIENGTIAYKVHLKQLITVTDLGRFYLPKPKNAVPDTIALKPLLFKEKTTQDIFDQCCEILGFDDWDHWPNLYKIYELIESFDKSLLPKNSIVKNFKHTANHFQTGPTARHLRPTKEQPPETSMTTEEAVSMFRKILQGFIEKYQQQ